MSDGNALLRAVLSDPDQDTPRLVYADWLEENGDQPDRAEFIRVQVEMATIPDPPPEPSVGMRSASRSHRLAALRVWSMQWKSKYYTLRARERELLKVIHSPVYYFDSEEVEYRRGFISEITCTAEDWLAHADAIYWHPEQTEREWVESYHAADIAVRLSPRPCPDTAQPIRRVVLTTQPTAEYHGFFGDINDVITNPQWPGIEFELPPPIIGPRNGRISINGGPAIPITGWSIEPPERPW